MRYALSLPIGGACGDVSFLIELAVLAEEAGWEAVLLEDYMVYHPSADCPTCDPWVALGGMATQTRRVLLGTAVTAVSRRRPWKLAREVATLDHLSGGRAALAVGLGDLHDHAFGAVGEATDNHVRAEMLDEALQVITGLWSGEPINFVGRHYQVRDVTFRPVPVQRPRVPIWVGGTWPRRGPLRRAARWDGCFFGFKVGPEGREAEMTPEDVRELRAAVSELRPQGLDGYEFFMGGRGRKENEAEEREWITKMAEAGATWWTEWVPPGEPDEMRYKVRRGPIRVKVAR